MTPVAVRPESLAPPRQTRLDPRAADAKLPLPKGDRLCDFVSRMGVLCRPLAGMCKDTDAPRPIRLPRFMNAGTASSGECRTLTATVDGAGRLHLARHVSSRAGLPRRRPLVRFSSRLPAVVILSAAPDAGLVGPAHRFASVTGFHARLVAASGLPTFHRSAHTRFRFVCHGTPFRCTVRLC